MKQLTPIAAALVAAALLGGCGAFEISPPTPITSSNEFNALWEASLEVLRENNFTVDRADPREGVITTFPMLGRHWFESWRTDARKRSDVAEGSLQTVYRQATVRVRQAQGKYAAQVQVQTSRSAQPNVRITDTSEAYELFLNPARQPRAAALPEKHMEPGAKTAPLGRDEQLEAFLREQIQFRTARKLAAVKP